MIARAINAISLNGNEFLLDNDNRVMSFKNKEDAVAMLKEKTGLSEEDAWEQHAILIWEEKDE